MAEQQNFPQSALPPNAALTWTALDLATWSTYEDKSSALTGMVPGWARDASGLVLLRGVVQTVSGSTDYHQGFVRLPTSIRPSKAQRIVAAAEDMDSGLYYSAILRIESPDIYVTFSTMGDFFTPTRSDSFAIWLDGLSYTL